MLEHGVVLEVLTSGDGRACGVTLHVIGEGSRDGVGAALGRAVVLATGGIGQVFRSSTNPREATGDGIAAALMTMRELDGAPLGEAVPMEKLPQTLVNVEVADRERDDVGLRVHGSDGAPRTRTWNRRFWRPVP